MLSHQEHIHSWYVLRLVSEFLEVYKVTSKCCWITAHKNNVFWALYAVNPPQSHPDGCLSSSSLFSINSADFLFPSSEHIFQRLIEIAIGLILNPLRNSISCFGDTSCDCSKSVAVPAKRNRISNRIFKICTF